MSYFTIHDPVIHNPTMNDSCINCLSLHGMKRLSLGQQPKLHQKVNRFHWLIQIGFGPFPLKQKSDKPVSLDQRTSRFTATATLFVERINLCKSCIICMLLSLWFWKEILADVRNNYEKFTGTYLWQSLLS